MEEPSGPATVVSVGTAEHYRWGGRDGKDCDGWYLMQADGAHVIEERMPPGTMETRHVHARARQFFYVLDGELAMEVEDHLYTLTRGQGVEIAPGQRHQAANHGETDLRILVMSQPPSHGDRAEVSARP